MCVWSHLNTQVPFTIWDFYFDISERHNFSARAWTSALMLHLTNPCTKRKVLSLNKSKSKIYKTKSLGNYITYILQQYMVVTISFGGFVADQMQYNLESVIDLLYNRIIIKCILVIYIYIYIYISSSSYRAGSTDIPDPLSPLLPIVHRPR